MIASGQKLQNCASPRIIDGIQAPIRHDFPGHSGPTSSGLKSMAYRQMGSIGHRACRSTSHGGVRISMDMDPSPMFANRAEHVALFSELLIVWLSPDGFRSLGPDPRIKPQDQTCKSPQWSCFKILWFIIVLPIKIAANSALSSLLSNTCQCNVR